MDAGSRDAISMAAKFVDIHGMQRGMDRIMKSNKAAFAAKTPTEIHPNAEESSTHSLLPEVDRMSRPRQSPYPGAGKRASPKQLSVATEEEYRLLGGSVKDDPEAVSIAKPVTRHSGMLGKIIGGPQPKNTLSRAPFSTGPAVDRKRALNPRGGRTQYALAVEVRKGGNVESVSKIHERNDTLPTPPSAKRRKLDRQASPASSDQTDPLDQVSPNAVSFHTGQNTSQPLSRAPSRSANSQVSGLTMKRNGSSEYRSVERMMDSNPKSMKQRHSDNRNYPADHVLLPSSPSKRSSMSNPIDISGDESQPTTSILDEARRPTSRGMIRQPSHTVNGTKSNTSKPLKARANLTHSPYFDKSRLLTTRANVDVKQRTSTQTLNRERSPGLAHQFIAADGTRRGSDVNGSSDADEIQSAPTTVGQNADLDAVFTVREMRPSSPSKQSSSDLRPSTPAGNLPRLAPSIIKPSFASSNAKRSSGRPTYPSHQDQETKPPWSVALAAISLPGKLLKDDDLGLVYDRKQKEYFVQFRGSAIRSTHNSLRIRPQKLVKILWESSGRKVRLESSRSGTEDNILDLELTSERDLSDLLQRLPNSCSFQVIGKPSEYMQKIFERKRSELRTLHGGTESYRPEEIEVITHSRQNNDFNRHLAHLDTKVPSRQLQKSLIVDELALNATHDTDKAASQPKNSMPLMPNGLPEGSDIKGILAKLKPAHNEHLNLRRSTRNSTIHDNESILSSLDGIPQKEKYSVKHGLGDPWKKPLTYPKVGKKKTTVEWSDLERLDEGEFLNDNLISFYLRYLEQRLEDERPDLAKRVYFFNTFFFATLTSAHKGKKRFNYEGVQKWTRTVDLFTYDYIIVPINEQAHWYLAIICNLPALDRYLATHEDSAISPVEDDGSIPNQGQSPTKERTLSLTEQQGPDESSTFMKEPNERETRDSFSQLSLDNDGVRLPAGDDIGLAGSTKVGATSEDKEMLNSQIEDTMPEFSAMKDAKDNQKPVKEPDEDQGESPKAAAKSRKSKRKSLPAPVTKVDPRKPAIITFDSLGQPRGQTIRILKDYLREEAKAKRAMEFEESQIKGINAKRIPQQDNYSDCGVFLLGYVDTFFGLETDPKDFITKTIQQTHGEKDWTKLVPGTLRASIRNQVRELHEIQTNERREESAKKSGKVAEKNDRKPELSPSHAPHQAKIAQKESSEAKMKDEVPATTRKAPESPLLGMLRTSDKTLETPPRREEEIDEQHDMFEELMLNTDLDVRKSAEHQRLYNSDDAEWSENNRGAPAVSRDDPSVIMVDSQSQGKASALSGVTYPSFSSGKQSYPESTSSKMVNPAPLSFEKEKSPELPSEIPDSQSSNPSPNIPTITPVANPKPAPFPESFTITSSSNKSLPEPQGESNDRSKRRKIGREERVDVQEAPEEEEMMFTIEKTIEKPLERRQEHKEPSKRRKRSARPASKEVEEVKIHVIDD